MKITADVIYKLRPNEIFVFGSNTAGRHGKGAALIAKRWGAKPGIGMGRTGQCYAIPTKDDDLKVLPPGAIRIQVREFLKYAREHPELEFLVTPIGCGLAGYNPIDIAPMFFIDQDPPPNVSLPESFWEIRDTL
jgi:hypothetical protein